MTGVVGLAASAIWLVDGDPPTAATTVAPDRPSGLVAPAGSDRATDPGVTDSATDDIAGTSPPSPVTLATEGDGLVLTGSVRSAVIRHSLVVAVRQLAGDDVVVRDGLRVDPAGPTEVDLDIQVTGAAIFDSSSADISDDFAATLDDLAAVLALVPDAEVTVSGHTDLTGDDETNDALSLARATAVVDHLVAAGIDRDRLDAVGFGSSRPISNNSTAEGRQANRRIEIEIVSS